MRLGVGPSPGEAMARQIRADESGATVAGSPWLRESALRRRLVWLMGGRLLVTSLLLGGVLFTVLEAKGVGAGLVQRGDGTATVAGVLFRTTTARPKRWEPMAISLSPSCAKLVSTLAGDHRRSDLELESIDVRRGSNGTVRIAVGSDFGYIAVGTIVGREARLSRCVASIRELPNNKAFEAVTLASNVAGGVMAFEEKAFKTPQNQANRDGDGAAKRKKQRRYRRQFLATSQPQPTDRPVVLRPPARPPHCKKVPRVAGSARVGAGTILIMSCKHRNGGYRYFLGAVAPGLPTCSSRRSITADLAS